MRIYKEKKIYEKETTSVKVVFFLDTDNYWLLPTIGIKKVFFETSLSICILCVRIFIDKDKSPF